ncbi:LysM peptidoglycan-binding domain-containing M23 family metallopeptidase [Ruegeria atlantica]|uniref:Murein hydrolase activator NlpD n=1 Tax=Ruegeria atlantica TaxID=81569 RepID=A0A0P1EFY5_9RHOB|nr:LysM peptidoglycan-binding domain-containing M23 family metallopeptidase [Ruegeria atlantica]CUH48666.1 Murein hydrolase activator NlpD precursor [Ruegeria atlantica]
MRAVSKSAVAAGVASLAFLAGCEGPIDYDLRGNVGGFSTADAAQAATANRPAPDARGVITYPNYQVAVARRGDTVGDIAARVGLPAAEVARFNGLQAADQLRDGEVVALPRTVSAASSVDIATIAGTAIDAAPADGSVRTSTLEPAQPTAAPAPAPAPAGPEPIRHKVKRGETAYTIARLYNVPVDALAEWNGLGSDFTVREGQFLLIPIKNQPAPRQEAAAVTTVPATTITQPGQGSPTPTPPSATQPLPDEVIKPAEPAPDVTAEAPTTQSNSALGLPVTGTIIRTYKKGSNEGIDIAASPGSPVNAAAAGTVAAITADADQVPIIVVKHNSDLLTVYANVENITVKKGARVKRGQKIASLRGGDNAYVHFEVRKGFESVDPEPYLR